MSTGQHLNIGRKGADKVSGFNGVITGRWERLNDSTRVELSPQKLQESGELIDPKWFPEAQVKILEDHEGQG